MTDLLEFDPNDTGEIPRPVGEIRMRIDTGEKTKNLRAERDAILAATGRLRHFDPVPDSLVTASGYDPDATFIFNGWADIDGDLRPAAPGPFPVPLPPTPPPAPKPSGLLRRFFHRPRHAQPAPLWTRVVLVVGGAMAAGGGIGVAIIWAVAR